MIIPPLLPPLLSYEEFQRQRLSRWERFAEAFTPTDDRLDYIALAMEHMVAGLNALPIEAVAGALQDIASQLSVLNLMPVDWGKADTGSDNTLIDRDKFWETDIWAGYEIAIIDGTGTGQIRAIKSNTVNSITTRSSWATKPDNTSAYVIRRARHSISDANKGSTGDTYADALDWRCRELGMKTIIIGNTGSNSLHYKILVRAEYEEGQDVEDVAETTLAAGSSAIWYYAGYALARIKVQVKSATAGSPTTYQIDNIGLPI